MPWSRISFGNFSNRNLFSPFPSPILSGGIRLFRVALYLSTLLVLLCFGCSTPWESIQFAPKVFRPTIYFVGPVVLVLDSSCWIGCTLWLRFDSPYCHRLVSGGSYLRYHKQGFLQCHIHWKVCARK